MCGYISIYNHLRSWTHPVRPFIARHSKYQPNGSDAVWLGSKGRCVWWQVKLWSLIWYMSYMITLAVCTINRYTYQRIFTLLYCVGLSWHLWCVCSDMDECAEDFHDCDRQHADCTNTLGSFICSCHRGYSGNGKHCQRNVLFSLVTHMNKWITDWWMNEWTIITNFPASS